MELSLWITAKMSLFRTHTLEMLEENESQDYYLIVAREILYRIIHFRI